MKNIKKIKINQDATIKQTLKVISDGNIKIAIVVDKNDKLLGTLTDGDIRRGFLKGLDINSSIKSIIFKNPISAKENDTKKKILKTALSKKIYQIPVVDNKGKVIGIHVLDELMEEPNKKSNLVVVMAGGKGMRLRPLTKNIPKPMLKVGNKPILQTIVEKFRESGYKNFIICVNYKKKIIMDYFGNGKKFDAQIKYVHEKTRMGTAGALSLLKKPDEPFFVINADVLTNLDFEKMLNFHQSHNSKATMCVKEYNIKLPYGEVKVNNEDIVSIEEKPKHKFFVNAGIYILSPKCIDLIPNKFYDMPSLFKKMIEKKEKTISFPLGEYWLDIGKSSDYEKAILEYNSILYN